MSRVEETSGSSSESSPKYKGIRRRKWGKWVSEIRVPHTQERLWLGSYTTPEAAAVAHDIAVFCLRGGASVVKRLNFPTYVPRWLTTDMSPKSIQKAASDAGSKVDADLQGSGENQVMANVEHNQIQESLFWEDGNDEHDMNGGISMQGGELSISVDDMEIW